MRVRRTALPSAMRQSLISITAWTTAIDCQKCLLPNYRSLPGTTWHLDCESDRLMEFAMREFGGMQCGYARVYAIREWVRNHVRFRSRSTNERTSAVDTIVERTGVCRDFAHLMIAICRALSIPARMSSMPGLWIGPDNGPAGFPCGGRSVLVPPVIPARSLWLIDPDGAAPYRHRPGCR
ncbi:transglutaminase-like domain-containing protein [Cupriavidus sp. CP313]